MSEPRIIQTEVVHYRAGVPLRRIVAVIVGHGKRTIRLDCGHKKVVLHRGTQWTPCHECAKTNT